MGVNDFPLIGTAICAVSLIIGGKIERIRVRENKLEVFQLNVFIVAVLAVIALLHFVFAGGVAQASTRISHSVILKHCKEFDYHDCNLVSAIVKKESSYMPKALNKKDGDFGSFGIMQVQCSTARMLGMNGKCKNLLKAKVSIKYGIRYLKLIEKRLKYFTPHDVVAAYNAGLKYNCDHGKCHYENIICKNFNSFNWNGQFRTECYPGEYINQEYVWKVIRHYEYLKGL